MIWFACWFLFGPTIGDLFVGGTMFIPFPSRVLACLKEILGVLWYVVYGFRLELTSLNPPGFSFPPTSMTDVLLLTLLSNYTNSLIVGLIRPVGLACWKTTVVSGRLRSHVDALSLVFPQQSVKDWVRVLGACSATTARVLCPVEGNRLSGALRTADLLGSLGVCFERSFHLLRAFALAKANFGWIGRAPTWSASSKLWTRCWSSVCRARFSSPWVRCILYGGNLHLDVCWATVLAGAIVRGHRRYTLPPGPSVLALPPMLCTVGCSPKAGLLSVLGFGPMLLPGFLLTSCPVVLPFCLVGSVLLNTIFALVGELGVGASGPILAVTSSALDLSPESFRSMSWSSIRTWALSSGAADSVALGLGAAVSPASFRVRRPELSVCPWPNCTHLGSWDRLAWSCPHRPSTLPRPSSPWLARLGWSADADDPTEVSRVQAWLCQCPIEIWRVRYPPESST